MKLLQFLEPVWVKAVDRLPSSYVADRLHVYIAVGNLGNSEKGRTEVERWDTQWYVVQELSIITRPFSVY